MNDLTYRQLPRYANSDLSELAAVHLGKKRFSCSQETLDFGTAFHQLTLEPTKLLGDEVRRGLSDRQKTDLMEMITALFVDSHLAMTIRGSECETVREWQCAETGLPLKGKLDICVLPKRQHLIDLKTTSCKSKAQFEQTISEYDYDRQAAFYLDSDPNARFFEFVGVQKTPPYNVYRVAYHRSDAAIVEGRRKMLRLLRLAKEIGFVPSSWGRKPE